MKEFKIVPTIIKYDSLQESIDSFNLCSTDLVFASNSTYNKLKDHLNGAYYINYRLYGNGEPTDLMVEGIYNDIKDLNYKRVFAIGGGTILDVAKLFALEQLSPVVDLFEGKITPKKTKELYLIPTTCGTGSEVTNISILELTTRNTKFGLANKELFPDYAILIPELLHDLPLKYFATSSIDALIHSIESFTSVKATKLSRMFSKEAMKSILKCYMAMYKYGNDERFKYLDEMLIASCNAGIAFSNAGCAAVHAMSYPLGAKYHVPHGEANYALFTGVYNAYMELKPDGDIKLLNKELATILETDEENVYQKIEELLNNICPKKRLSEYGMTREDINTFTNIVLTKQTRLMNNNYTLLDESKLIEIYERLF